MGEPLSERLQQLDDFLLSAAVGADAMGLSELDGLIAGVAVCPELIKPSEWLEAVWGETPPEFESEDQVQSVYALILAHYNDVLRGLERGDYAAIFDVGRDDSLFWELWIEGFWRAVLLRPEAWLSFAEQDDEAIQKSVFCLTRLYELASTPPGDLEPLEIDGELEELAPDLIPDSVDILHGARRAAARRKAPKVGRNDPCPCGSGRKYKRCCLGALG